MIPKCGVICIKNNVPHYQLLTFIFVNKLLNVWKYELFTVILYSNELGVPAL